MSAHKTTPLFLDTLERMDLWLEAIEELPVDSEEQAEEHAFELELYEGNLYAVIFEYCVERGYTLLDFPQRYLHDEKLADEEITYERMGYYIWHTALEAPDVFDLIRKIELWANPDLSDVDIRQELAERLAELGPAASLFEPVEK